MVKGYYKTIKTVNDFDNNNYIEHESKGDKDTTFSSIKYFNMIKQVKQNKWNH